MAAIPSVLKSVASWLRCPVCRDQVALQDRSLVCPAGHSFDIARQGYVNLLGGPQPQNADTADMLAARDAFLSAGHFTPLADVISGALAEATRIVEVGAGTGYYLAEALGQHSEAMGLAIDISVAAAKRCAQAHPRLASIVADTWRGLPVENQTVDGLLCVFAPRNPAEFVRVVAPGGRLVIAVPDTDHLVELRQANQLLSVAADKPAQLREAMTGFELISQEPVRAELKLDQPTTAQLIEMGPNAFHHPATTTAVDTRLSVQVLTFRRIAG